MSASERQICSMNDWTVLGSVANHSNFWPAAASAASRRAFDGSAENTTSLPSFSRDRDQEERAGQALVDPLGELGVDLGGAGVAERDPARRRQRPGVLGAADAMPA